MPLYLLDMEKLDDYISFYNEIHPEIKDAKKRFLWQFIDNPFLDDKNAPYVLLFSKEGKIVGQSLLNPFEWHYQGKTYRDYFGNDLYVMEEYRGSIGSALAIKTIGDRTNYFGIGFSKIAENIWKHLGVRKIGNEKKFIWLHNPLKLMKVVHPCKFLGNQIPLKLPKKISQDNMLFSLMPDFESIGLWKENYWKDTLQFSHNKDFIRWRFFESPRKYHFYFAGDSYFVVRRSFFRGLNLLLLVDYRVQYMNKEAFRSIIRITKNIAKMNRMDGVFAVSSHKFFDDILKKNFFLDIRGRGLIMTNKTLNVSVDKIKKRELVYATMADSDVELALFQ